MFEERLLLPERTAKASEGPEGGKVPGTTENSKEARVLGAEKGHSDCFIEKRP